MAFSPLGTVDPARGSVSEPPPLPTTDTARLREMLPADVEVIREGTGGERGAGDLVVYFHVVIDGESVTHKVRDLDPSRRHPPVASPESNIPPPTESEHQATARRTIDAAQSALSAVASVCARDRVPLLGRAFDPVSHVGVDGGVRASPFASTPSSRRACGPPASDSTPPSAPGKAATRARPGRGSSDDSEAKDTPRASSKAETIDPRTDPSVPPPAAEAARRTRSRDANDDPSSDPSSDPDPSSGDAGNDPDPFSVAAAFASVPSPTAARRARPRETIAAETAAAGQFFGAAPEEVLHAILSRIGEDAFEKDDTAYTDASSANLARIAATCRYLRDASRETASGIRCRLYPHQRDALRAMVARESGGVDALAPHPALRRLAVRFRARDREERNEDGNEDGSRDAAEIGRDSDPGEEDSNARVAWALVSDIRDGAYFPGALHVGSRPSSAYADVRGGIFADDPGLGKSVTALALVTRSRAALPLPPPGAGEITRGTPPSYVVPAPAGAKRWSGGGRGRPPPRRTRRRRWRLKPKRRDEGKKRNGRRRNTS